MSETNTFTNDFTEAFKGRLKAIAVLVVLFPIVWGINNGLWALDKIFITFIITALMPVKFFVIIFVFWRVWLLEKKIAFWLFLPMVLLIAFIFDFATVPELWAYRFGTETQGRAIEFTIKSRNKHFVTYEFNAGNWSYRKEQEVTTPFYESLEPGEPVVVKYLPDSPRFSFLVDPPHLKSQTLLVFFTGFAFIVALSAIGIEEKLIKIVKNVFQSKKPA
jgi:hypothetical protein